MEEIKFSNGMMAIPTELQDCYVLEPAAFGDQRGYFSPFFLQEYADELGFERVVQTNRSFSSKGVLRGLHFQKDPYAQAKIVEVVTGAAIDVVVDIREGSPSYGKSTAVLLTPYDSVSKTGGKQLYVPRGFAHGFISLKDNTTFQYLIDNHYKKDMEGGIYYNDPAVGIDWERLFKENGINEEDVKLKDEDMVRPALADSPTYFVYKRK